MMKFMSMVFAGLFALSVVAVAQVPTEPMAQIVPTAPPTECVTPDAMLSGLSEGVSGQVYTMQETISVVRNFIPRSLHATLPQPSQVSGSMATYKEGSPYFVFAFLDKENCLMPPLMMVGGNPPQSLANRDA